MNLPFALFWTLFCGAFACAVLGAWSLKRRESGPEKAMLFAALGFSAVWALVAAATGIGGSAAGYAESLRNLAWLVFVYHLLRSGGSDAVAVRPVFAALAVVGVLHPLALLAVSAWQHAADPALFPFRLLSILRLAFIIGALVLVHNLAGRGAAHGRAEWRWTALGLATLWICDLNFYTVAYLSESLPASLELPRALALVALTALVSVGRTRAARLPLRPSRAVAFQTLSLLVIGVYLLVMVAAARSLAWLGGGGTAPLTQIGFVFTSAVLALLVLPSARLRGWMKVAIAKHLFQHRYDYRAEWLRFTQTIGRGDGEQSLQERVIQALGDITDSSSGLLLLPGEGDEMVLAARWNWRTLDVPAQALCAQGRRFLEREGFIVAVDTVREGNARHGEDVATPRWLLDEPKAWAMVPLQHFERLVGVVILARPPHPRELDWEDFDLLRVVGRQLASYLSEQSGQEALLDASQFDEFNRRIAFVMHDVKNLASQLNLLCRNAERHGDNPAFRADMMVTVRNAAEKLNGLLARLSRYGGSPLEKLEEVDPNEVVRSVAAAKGREHRVEIAETAPGARVIGNRETLEQVIVHLVQNAIDASGEGSPVLLRVRSEGMHAAIEVVDSGSGMSADFIRNRLFKPFVSTKPGGFGIGAFEARELVKAMQGRLDVESREGLGSRFTIRLPLAEAAALLEKFKRNAAGLGPDGSQTAKVA